MKKFLLASMALVSLLSAFSTRAGIRVSQEDECRRFSVDDTIVRGQRASDIISSKTTHGIITKNIKINFDKRIVSFNIESAVILGFNKRIMKEKVFISSEHPRIDELVDMYRKDLFALDSICISNTNEIIEFTTNIENK